MGHRIGGALVALAAACTAWGCEVPGSSPQAAGTELRQSAHRVRGDVDTELNADAGWAGGLDEPAVVTADRPFRLRVEAENPASTPRDAELGLQVRRNGGDWERVQAQDFPYPLKEAELDVSSGSDDWAERWTLLRGSASDLSPRETEDGGQYLRVAAQAGPVLTLAKFDTPWDPVEVEAVLRLPGAGRAGIVFGYRDVDDHLRVDLEADGPIRIIRVLDGREAVLASRDAAVKSDRWIEVAIALDGSELTVDYEWDPHLDGIELTVDTDTPIPPSPPGLHVPAGGAVDLEALAMAGVAASPRVSIVSSDRFEHGAETEDLLAASRLPFHAGAGVSHAESAPTWSAAAAHGEWEFPLVVRYFADGAVTNESGDVFEFRVADAGGASLPSTHVARVTLEVPDRHLGGTFVETPVRIGPWQGAGGDLYFIMEPAETDNVLMMVKSTDGGRSWRETDGEDRPLTSDLEGLGSTFVDGRIHILHQTSDHVFYHVFRTADGSSPDAWEIRDERLASPTEPPTQVADLAVRSDGSVVGVYGDRERIRIRVRSPDGEWSDPTIVDAAVDRVLSGPVLARGAGDVVHLAYTGSDGTAWYRRILPDGRLTPRRLVASELGTEVEDAGSILPLVYLQDTGTVSIAYRLATGELWERRAGRDGELGAPVRVTDRAVVQNAADAEQVGADAVGHGSSVHVLFIEEGTGRIFHTHRDGAEWSEPMLEVDGVNALWVRGAIVEKDDGNAVYGYVYDAGSYGGSGMNRYAEAPLP